MGWNTTVILLNDGVDNLQTDKEFGENLRRAVAKVGCYRVPVDVPIGNHVNACSVIESHHADQIALVAVGGNYATVVHRTCGHSHHKPEEQERLLREWADSMGFRLVRKKA